MNSNFLMQKKKNIAAKSKKQSSDICMAWIMDICYSDAEHNAYYKQTQRAVKRHVLELLELCIGSDGKCATTQT